MVEKCHLCEEDLVWVAYGACRHREVCSTCIVRSRFNLQDLRCYQCQGRLDTVYVTEPSNENQEGPYWYHENSKALFTNLDEYRRIEELCRLVCTSCGETNFECIGELMTHLYERHRLYMCTACLLFGSRFIREQKLFTKAQLNKHIRTGDSEVDGNVIERAGFTGHLNCELCKNPFYGDEEVFVHIKSLSCRCHICDGLRPGFRDNDIEDHFLAKHIDPQDGYLLAPFSIIRAFDDERHLEWHNGLAHPTQSLQAPSDPASAIQNRVSPSSSRSEIKAFSKAIRGRLFKALKDTSRKYRQGLIDARSYLEYLKNHGLSDLVLDVASFCPDPRKHRELIETYIASLREEVDDTVEEENDDNSNVSEDQETD